MILKLDASHICVLEHWETLTRMKQCAEQIETYLLEVARRAMTTVSAKFAGQLTSDDQISKHEYFQFIPKRVERWKNSSNPLLAIGIEGVAVSPIVYPTADYRCSAYVYSPYRAEKSARTATTDKLATAAKPLKGIEITLDYPERGYLFETPLSSIALEEFSKDRKLESYFSDAISPIIEWYLNNEHLFIKAAS